jgi:hypothetical protein
MTLVEAINGINQELRIQLEKYHCERGELRFQVPSIISLSGIDAYDKPVLIWQTGSRLGYLLSQYVNMQADCGGVIIAIRLPDQFFYTPVAKAAIQQTAKQREIEQQGEVEQAKLQLRQELAQRRTPFGWELAEKVANALQRNHSIGYGHRDYCGMGFEYRQGIYCYGELWDGAMPEPTYEWQSKENFVAWLAHQSDASLGRLDAKDPFYWGNQTITRERLISLG